MPSIQITVPNDKGSQKFTIGEIARMILETHESTPSIKAQDVIMEIMKQAQDGGEPPVSFRHGIEPPDEEIVFVTAAGHPYKSVATAARAARIRADLQDIDWETVSVDGGWVIREIFDYDSWSEYHANKETMTADKIGYMILVSTADMTRFCRSTVYRKWASQLRLGVPVIFGGEGAPLAKGQEDAPAQTLPPEPPQTTTIGAETKCKQWLIGLMSGNSRPDRLKSAYRDDARDEFNVGTKAFDRAWGNAVAETGNTAWSRPGPKS
jgi:hypothetical protein